MSTKKLSTSRAATPIPTRKPPYRLYAAAALCLLTLAGYSNSLHGGFTLDNRGLLLEDPRLREASAENLRDIGGHTYWWPKGESGLYRPVTTLSYLFNYSVLGDRDQPEMYHWLNLMLHEANVLLAFALALALFSEFWPSFFTAAIWAVHPVLTESVSNIVGRADLLAGMCVLGGLLLYQKSTESTGRRRWLWLAALAAVSAVGMFSKESAAVLPGVIVLYELTQKRRWRAMLPGLAATLLPLALFLYQRSAVLAASVPASFPFTDNPLVAADFGTRILTALKVIGLYLGLLVWPMKLSCDYSYQQISLAHGGWEDWLAWMAVAAVAALSVVLYRRNARAFFLIAFAFLALLPASNLLFPIGTMMAERLLYLPAIAFAGCLAIGAYALARRMHRERFAAIFLGVITILLAARTYARNEDWRNDLTLAKSAVHVSPASFKTHSMLAQALYPSETEGGNLDQAIAERDKAIAILDPLPDVHNLAREYRVAGGFYLLRGDFIAKRDPARAAPAEAQAAYCRALALAQRCVSILRANGNGSMEDAQELLANAWLRTNDTAKSYEAALAAHTLDPLEPVPYRLMASALLASGRADDAAVTMTEGAIVTADQALRSRLIELYRSGLDREGCALIEGPNGPAINPRCGIVSRHICEAAPRALRTLSDAGKADAANRLRDSFKSDSGCPAAR